MSVINTYFLNKAEREKVFQAMTMPKEAFDVYFSTNPAKAGDVLPTELVDLYIATNLVCLGEWVTEYQPNKVNYQVAQELLPRLRIADDQQDGSGKILRVMRILRFMWYMNPSNALRGPIVVIPNIFKWRGSDTDYSVMIEKPEYYSTTWTIHEGLTLVLDQRLSVLILRLYLHEHLESRLVGANSLVGLLV